MAHHCSTSRRVQVWENGKITLVATMVGTRVAGPLISTRRFETTNLSISAPPSCVCNVVYIHDAQREWDYDTVPSCIVYDFHLAACFEFRERASAQKSGLEEYEKPTLVRNYARVRCKKQAKLQKWQSQLINVDEGKLYTLKSGRCRWQWLRIQGYWRYNDFEELASARKNTHKGVIPWSKQP